MKSQLTFTPEVLTFCTLYNHCDYCCYLTLLVIYERFNILAMFCYNHPAQLEEDWQPLRAWFLSRCLSREFFLATMLLHLHCLLFVILGWVSVQHFVTLADVKKGFINTFD